MYDMILKEGDYMIKLVVSDMDGTLINHQSGISDRNLKAIQKLKNQGIEFAIASGRDYHGVRSILDQYCIECDTILGNGAQYCDKNGQVIMDCYLNKNVCLDIIRIFETAHIPYMIFTTKGFYTRLEPEYVQNMFIERGIRRFHNCRDDYFGEGRFASSPCNHLQMIHDFDKFMKDNLDIIKIEAFSLDASEITPAKKLLAHIPTISYLSSFDDNVEVTNEFAQKGYILKKVAKRKYLKTDEVAVLGDGMNDLSLFEEFQHSFAPMNAEQRIKELAYQVVSDCQEDGFAEAIDIIMKHI